MNRQSYNNIQAINFSSLKHYLRSPQHFYHAWKTPQTEEDDTPARAFGRAAHKLILEPESFKETFVYLDEKQRPFPDKNYQTKANAEWKATMLDYLKKSGKEVVTQEQYESLLAMASSVKANKSANALLKGCEFERIIEWVDSDTGVRCKAIVDFSKKNGGLVGDLKTMEDARPEAFGQFISKWLTFMQLAMYMDGLSAVDGIVYNTAFVIAVEKTAPFVCQPYYLSESDIELGRKMYKTLLEQHVKCVEAGTWGGYEANFKPDSLDCVQGVIVSKLPGYAYTKIETNELYQ